MIDLNKIVKYMNNIINIYPDGCAAYNWRTNCYSEILDNKRLPEEWELNDIIEDCLKEIEFNIGFCGCGCPEYTREVIRQILNIQYEKENRLLDYENSQKKFSELCNCNMDNENYHGLIQFVLYILNDKDILEHGGSVSGSWLTTEGKMYLDLLNMQYELSKSE